MDALAMLREDHRKVKELFRQFEEAPDKATKQAAAETALVELNIHAVLEEEIFYPAVRRQGNGRGELVKRAEQEHHTAEQLMDELMKMEPGNSEFDAKFHVLIENVKKHIEEEEAEMLPQAAEVGMARLERLGQQMAERKQALMREPNGRSAGRTRASTTSGTRTRRTTSTSGTRRKSSSTGTRRTSASGTRRTTASGTRRTTASGTRRTTASGTRSKSTAAGTRSTPSGTRASTARAKSPARTTASSAKTTASRAKTTAKRTVKQAGTRARTTKTRSNTSGRRSGSQSGR
jgi:hemerythrin-like domain-containing protein